jgi:hypothetical protein
MAEGYGPSPGPPAQRFPPGPVPGQLILIQLTCPGPIWTGQRGPLTISGITQVVLAAGDDVGIPGLRPHRCRQLRAGSAENAAVTERVFSD